MILAGVIVYLVIALFVARWFWRQFVMPKSADSKVCWASGLLWPIFLPIIIYIEYIDGATFEEILAWPLKYRNRK